MVTNILLILIGFVLLIKGADFLVSGSVKIAKKLYIPEIIIGLTIVSIGTSMPELIVSITSALSGHSDIAIGNVIGSNICNILLILGTAAVIKPLVFNKETKYIEIPIALVTTLVLLVLGNDSSNMISRRDGVILLTLFIAFIAYTIYMGKRESNEEKAKEEYVIETPEKFVLLKAFGLIALGMVGLKFGGDMVVDNATAIAQILGISEKVISLTIGAIGTSLPELATSATAAFKGETDIAIGNAVGSNIFNILLILGVGSIIKPMQYALSYNRDILLLIIITLLLALFTFTGKKDTMTRWNGLICLAIYIAYTVSLFIV